MINVSESNIHLCVKANTKQEAIELIAKAFELSGNVKSGYADAMMKRETQISTYLGNGIAMPHGALNGRYLVTKTGVQIFQFPDGVNWDGENIVYIAIGIAANSDDHLSLLSKVSSLLQDENKVKQLTLEKDIDNFKAIFLNNAVNSHLESSIISLDVDTHSLLTLVATNADKLLQQNAIDSQFISEVISNSALPLGNGIWITDSTVGNKKNAIAFSRPKEPFQHNSKLVQGVITVSVVNEQMNSLLSLLLDTQFQQILLSGDQDVINRNFYEALLTQEHESIEDNAIEKTFTIHNQYGLHTRPAGILVNIIKRYNATVMVKNLDRNTEFVNAQSLIQIASLGVSKGQRVKFIASGVQAKEVMREIEKGIITGLGENL